MDAKDMNRLMTLLDALCPNTPEAKRANRDEKTIYAWMLALEPYSYESAKAGALAHSRTSRFYPSVSEIISCIPSDAAPPVDTVSYGDISDLLPIVQAMQKYSDALATRYHAAGIPTPSDAKQQGLTYAQFCKIAAGQ